MKNLLPYLPVLVLAFTLIGGWFRLNADTSSNKEEIKIIKTDIKEIVNEADKEIKDLKTKDQNLEKAVEVSQVKQEEINKKVEQVDNKVDKVIDLLIKIDKKK